MLFKVRGVIVLLDELISQIRSDQARRRRRMADEPLPINYSNNNINQEQSTSDLSGQFIYAQLLIECLLRMKSTSTEKDELIALCQQYYKGNEVELSLLNEFKKYYSADRALWWYTREAFPYRLMNKALRVLNIDLLFLLRFFLRDVHQQLEQQQSSFCFPLYRCQLMSKEEIQLLQNSIGEYITMNSYFSTSVNRRQALQFLDYSSDLEQVLFEIDADPQSRHIKPFADITSYSYFPEEEEILFMLGSIFQIISVDCDKDELWTVRMVLVSDDHHDSSVILNQMKSEYMGHETNILTYGNILRDMGKLDEAEKYYRRFLDQSSKNFLDIANCYCSLGTVASANGKYDESLQWHLDSLEIKTEKLNSHDPSIASSYNSMAIVYRKKGDYQKALVSYEKALKIWKKSLHKNHPKVAMCLNNIGAVYEDQKNYPKAFEYYKEALNIAKKCEPTEYRVLSAIHNNFGNIYCTLNDYNQALEYYNEGFRLKSKILPNRHPSLATALQNIGMVHEKMGAIEEALVFYTRANSIKY